MRENILDHLGEGKYLGSFWRGKIFWNHFGEGKHMGPF